MAAPIFVWLVMIAMVVFIGLLVTGGVVEEAASKLGFDSVSTGDDASRLFLAVVVALGLASFFALPLRHFWERAARRGEFSQSLAAKTRERVFQNRDLYYGLLRNRVESMRAAARRLLRQTPWGRESDQWTERAKYLLFTMARFQSAYEAALESNVDFVFVSEDMTRRVRRRLRSIQLALGHLLDDRDYLASVVRIPEKSHRVTLKSLTDAEFSFPEFVKPLEGEVHKGGPLIELQRAQEPAGFGSLLEALRSLVSNREGSTCPPALGDVWDRVQDLSYVDVQKLELLADGAFDEITRGMEELDLEWMGHEKKRQLRKRTRQRCIDARGLWTSANDATYVGSIILLISSVRGFEAAQTVDEAKENGPTKTAKNRWYVKTWEGVQRSVRHRWKSVVSEEPDITVKPSELGDALMNNVEVEGFDRSGIAVVRLRNLKLEKIRMLGLEVEIGTRDGTASLAGLPAKWAPAGINGPVTVIDGSARHSPSLEDRAGGAGA